MTCKAPLLFCLILFLFPFPGTAQEKPVEFGVDAGANFLSWDGDDEDSYTIIGIPAFSNYGMATVRAGFFLSPRISIEPALSFARVSDDNSSSTLLNLFPSVLYHFKDFERVALPYVRVGGGLIYQRSSYDFEGDSESDSETQFGLGGGVGVKVPFAETAFVRLEAGFDKWLEKGDPEDYDDFAEGFRVIKLSVGISAIIN
jgi:hypothetical protein